jgi:hypothetical protein
MSVGVQRALLAPLVLVARRPRIGRVATAAAATIAAGAIL